MSLPKFIWKWDYFLIPPALVRSPAFPSFISHFICLSVHHYRSSVLSWGQSCWVFMELISSSSAGSSWAQPCFFLLWGEMLDRFISLCGLWLLLKSQAKKAAQSPDFSMEHFSPGPGGILQHWVSVIPIILSLLKEPLLNAKVRVRLALQSLLFAWSFADLPLIDCQLICKPGDSLYINSSV